MKFRNKNEQNIPVQSLSKDTKATRRKAHTVFISLCNRHSTHLLSSLKSLVSESEKLWQGGEISDEELALMYEAFVLISNEMKNFDSQFQFISYLLDTPKKLWQSEPITQLISSEVLLLKSVGIIDEPNSQTKEQLFTARYKMYQALNTFRVCAKRMPSNPKVYILSLFDWILIESFYYD